MSADRAKHRVRRALRWLGQRELGALVSVTVLFGAVWLVAWLASEVVEGDTRAFDEYLLLGLRTPGDTTDPIGPMWLERMINDITSLGSFTVYLLVTFAVLGYLVLRRKARVAGFVVLSIAGGQLLSSGLKRGFDRPRPSLAEHHVNAYLDPSFPSGHTLMATVTFLTLAAMLARVHPQKTVKAYLLVCAFLLASLVGFSRVYLGVHWPTDVIAGLAIGSAWASLCWLAAGWLQRRGRIEREEAGGELRAAEA